MTSDGAIDVSTQGIDYIVKTASGIKGVCSRGMAVFQYSVQKSIVDTS